MAFTNVPWQNAGENVGDLKSSWEHTKKGDYTVSIHNGLE